MAIATYSPTLCQVVFRGYRIGGYMDGTFIELDRTEDVYKTAVGAQGSVARVHNPNRTGMLQVTLQQTSPSNDILSGFADLDDPEEGVITGLGKGDLLFGEMNGTTIARAADAWVRKLPKIDRGTDLQGVVWVFDCAKLIMHAGSIPVG